MTQVGATRHVSIWIWAFGYFAAYAPYSLLTKALSDGRLGPKVTGNMILPVSTFASVLAAIAFLVGTGWWRSATRRTVGRFAVPVPTRWTALSGLCGATILTTTTLAYTFSGASIVFMMLLMRGGLLALAPVVDVVSGRRVRWMSGVALALTLGALIIAFIGRPDVRVSVTAMVDVAAYLTAYFVRLRFMSRLAKSDSAEASRRYFVEEQLVSTPAAFAALGVLAVVGQGTALEEIRRGFTEVPFGAQWPIAAAIGVLSQGTGIFGALVLLDKSENTFSVPVNRASSILAGVLATLLLALLLGGPPLEIHEGFGAGFVIAAIAVLAAPGLLKRSAAA